MVFVLLLILGIFIYEGYFLVTRKKWKELIIVSVILGLCFYFTLAENQLVPEIQIIGTLDNLIKPLSKFIEEM